MCFCNRLDVFWTEGHTGNSYQSSAAPSHSNHGCLNCMVLQCKKTAYKGLYLIAKQYLYQKLFEVKAMNLSCQ